MHLWTKNEVKICEKVLNNLGQLRYRLPLFDLLIVVAVQHWCYVLLLYPLALDVKTLETRRSLVFDGIDIDANGKHCRLKVADENIAFPRR